MNLVKRYPLVSLMLLGLIIRLIISPLDYSFDVNNHIAWAKDLWNRGFINFYGLPSTEVYASLYPNYPPFAMYIFYSVYPLFIAINKLTWWLNVSFSYFPSQLVFFVQSRVFEAMILKLPAIIADLLLARIVYIFAKKIASW
ncbi:MAG: hypothetical protein UZ22_OP11002000352 [Microgenomates bacterium OLB23]|nr:MAG: hypothetical protein UZ22_OP11002000352 [Microgenomates bacterium OLB23]